MPKYLLQASYTAEGLRGLVKDTASGRRAAVKTVVKGLGGKLESMYYSFGKDDALLIMDLPDNVAAAALSTAVGASGMVRVRTTPLITVEEIDKALARKSKYRAPGGAK
jgi:uncharacterized protein with GYD domain